MRVVRASDSHAAVLCETRLQRGCAGIPTRRKRKAKKRKKINARKEGAVSLGFRRFAVTAALGRLTSFLGIVSDVSRKFLTKFPGVRENFDRTGWNGRERRNGRPTGEILL